MNMKRIHSLLVLALSSWALVSLSRPLAEAGESAKGPPVNRQFSADAMLVDGTPVSITIVALSSDEGLANAATARATMRAMSIDRELFAAGGVAALINGLPPRQPMELSPDVFAMIKRATALSALTDGWFDVAAPSPKHTFTKRDWRRIDLDESSRTVMFKSEGMVLDLSRISKGYIADIIMDECIKAGFTNAMAQVGSMQRNIGRDIHTPWGIVVEFGSDKAAEHARRVYRYAISDVAAATVTPEGLGRGLIDPRNKKHVPEGVMRNATIVASDATTAVAFALATYVIGPRYGMKFIGAHPEVRGIIVDGEGNLNSSPGIVKSLNGEPQPAVTTDGGPDDLRQKRREEASDL